MDDRRPSLKVISIERIRLLSQSNFMAIRMVYRNPKIGRGWKSYSKLKYTGNVSPLSTKQGKCISLWFNSKHKLNSLWWWKAGAAKNKHYLWLFQIKKIENKIFLSPFRRMRQQDSKDLFYLNLWERTVKPNNLYS